MQSTAKDVSTYLEEVPAERKAALVELRRQCLAILKGFEESMQYGAPGYSRNGVVEVGFASQKHFIGLYILRTDVMKAHLNLLKIKGVSVGKGCIRYSKPEKIDFKVVRSMLKGHSEVNWSGLLKSIVSGDKMNSLNFRKEKDSLGELQVPASAYYGIQTQRAVDNFPVSGLQPWRAFIWSIAAVKRAAALVNFELGLFNDREVEGNPVRNTEKIQGNERGKHFTAKQLADSIAQAAKEVMDGKWDDQFVVDPFQAGAGTSHNMNANEVIANRATQILGGELGQYYVHPNDHVNMAQSTNDVIPTSIRLGVLWRLDELLTASKNLRSALEDKAHEFDEVVKSGRTHLQDAVPVRLGQEFSAYAKAVERDIERVRRSAEGLSRLGIGGTAVGSGLNAHPEYHARMVKKLSELTGLQLVQSDNLFESMQSMADAADFSASLRTLALTLIRIANDFRLLSSGPSTGFDEIRLPAVQPGSSIMPGKVNPVMAEMLDQAMFHVIGCDTTVAMAAQAGQLELNVMMPILAHNLFEMMQVVIGSVNAFTERAVKGVTANREKAEGWLAKNAIVVTALNPVIGYSQGAALVKEALANNASIKELAIEKAKAGRLKHRDEDRPVTAAEIESALGDLRKLTEGGIVGGTGSGG